MWFLIFVVLLSPVLLAVVAIALNRPPLFEVPGVSARLAVYLRSNVAQTADQSLFPELETPTYAMSAEQLNRVLQQSIRQLGWQNIRQDGSIWRAEVITPLLHFVDDIEARVEPVEGGCRLHLRSVSRVGRGDFAANQRHLLDLLGALSTMGHPVLRG